MGKEMTPEAKKNIEAQQKQAIDSAKASVKKAKETLAQAEKNLAQAIKENT